MQRGGYVYIMASANRRVVYTGMTANLSRRVEEHRLKVNLNSFAARKNCVVLVYFRGFDRIEDAIREEKRLKGYGRDYKDKLIIENNPHWQDLWEADVKHW